MADGTIEVLAREWEEQKGTISALQEQIKRIGHADPLLEEKFKKQGEALLDLQARIEKQAKEFDAEIVAIKRRPGAGDGAGEQKEREQKEREQFHAYARKGDAALEVKAGSMDSDPAGGYALPTTIASKVVEYAQANQAMRRVCTVSTVDSERYVVLVDADGSTYGHVGETEARTETTAPSLKELAPAWGEIYAEPAITERLLGSQSVIDFEAWYARRVANGFNAGQNAAFTSGTGIKKAKGILAYTLSTDVDGTRAFGSIQKVVSGSSGAFVGNTVLETVYQLDEEYLGNARWMMPRLGQLAVMQLKGTQNDHYLWQPSLAMGQPATLAGFPIVTNDDMAAPGAGVNAAMFGDFAQAYEIVDLRGSLKMLRDPYTSRGYVKLYTRQVYGGHVINDRAVKVYQLT